MFSHLSVTIPYKYRYYPHFTDEESKDEREEVTCPESQLVSGGAGENDFSLGIERLSSWAAFSVCSKEAVSSLVMFASAQVLPLPTRSSPV